MCSFFCCERVVFLLFYFISTFLFKILFTSEGFWGDIFHYINDLDPRALLFKEACITIIINSLSI